MTTRPSDAPWADGPYKLITTPLTYKDINSHSAIYCASEMAYSHNCLLRGLNSILLQGPHIASADKPSAYNAQTVHSLLFFIESWVKTVQWHHHTEETIMFPSISAMTDQSDLLSGAQHQHDDFHDGLIALGEMAKRLQSAPAEYRWANVESVINGFAEALTTHLYDEIELFLSFERFDSDGLRKCWDQAEEVAKAKGRISFLYDIFPCVLGCCDKTYEGGNNFPPLPSFMPWAIRYWFGTYNTGAWDLAPCDFWGRPKPLSMLPENQKRRQVE